MAKYWVSCRTEAEARVILVFAAIGSFDGGVPMPCRISPLDPKSVDIDFGDTPFEPERFQKNLTVTGFGKYEDGEELPEATANLNRIVEDLLAPVAGQLAADY
ncbi:MAG: hypothetical protein ACM3KM_01665 [Acidobacteriaceae bacterium]